MATVKELVDKKELIKFAPLLECDQFEERRIFMRREAWEWCFSSKELGYKCPNSNSFDIVHAVLTDFCAGHMFRLGLEIRRLKEEKNDVWEIKTPTPDPVRVFGWFYAPNVFIASHCAYRKALKKYKDYEPHIEKVIDLREKLNCVSPKFKWQKDEKKYFHI